MRKRIMVVDDDKITLKMCKFILEKQDHEVVTAESGKRCLEFLREPSNPRIDCILLDIEMPLLNGFNTLSSIRQSEKLKDVPDRLRHTGNCPRGDTAGRHILPQEALPAEGAYR